MDCSTPRHVETRARHIETRSPAGWVRILADNYEAVVSVDTICWACHGEPHFLRHVLESELGNGSDAVTIRLDCDADVGKHVVASLRYGHDYIPPYENQQLLRAIRHQLEFLCLPVPFGTKPAHDSTEVVMVPAYRTHMYDEPPDDPGLLVYSSTGQGWAELTGSRDTRPNDMRSGNRNNSCGGRWLAGSLRIECTGASTDLVYAVRNDPPGRYNNYPERYGYTGVLLDVGSNKYKRLKLPSYFHTFYNRGMSAGNNKVFLLGGICKEGRSTDVPSYWRLTSVPFHVLDPHIGSWMAATSPMPYTGTVPAEFWSRPAVISDQQGSLVVCLGGKIVSSEQQAKHQASPMTDLVAMYDVRGGKWQHRPSGCRWPSAATATSLTAVAADPYTIMVMSTHRQPAAVEAANAALQAAMESLDLDAGAPAEAVPWVPAPEEARTELLDIRTWRWRPGATLQKEYCNGAGSGLLQYQGKVLSIGGKNPCIGASTDVHQYDVCSDRWSAMAPLPFPLEYAAPVVVSLPSTLKH